MQDPAYAHDHSFHRGHVCVDEGCVGDVRGRGCKHGPHANDANDANDAHGCAEYAPRARTSDLGMRSAKVLGRA